MIENLQKIRTWLAALAPLPAHQASVAPSLDEIYTPQDHEAALDPDRLLVVGGRGVGKSFWAGALQDTASREMVGARYPKLKLHLCKVALGFTEGDSIATAGIPSANVITELMEKDHFKAETIWRAVLIHSLRDHIDAPLPSLWRGKDGLVAWVDHDAERLQLQMKAAEQKLEAQGLRQLIVFDGLDRLADNWPDIRVRARALMRVALALRSYRAIKLKIFMRVDQADDALLWDFPDASKLSGTRVDLRWERRDLYGLLFAQLANHVSTRTAFDALLVENLEITLKRGKQKGLPRDLMEDEVKQEAVFALLAGQYMGSDRRRGKTYSWLHNHLADAFGNVSPRTFLAAIRAAAAQADNVDDKVIEPKGLQAGLQVASAQCIEQLREDFLWIRETLEPLADLAVPCVSKSLFARWAEAGTIAAIATYAKTNRTLAPVEFDSVNGVSPQSLLTALLRLGVAEKRPDGRINVPDIYRVAAKLLKRGGVKAKA
jgi:hypothetical protein